jgi:hypothetical protein
VVAVARAIGCPAGALHCGGIWGQHAEAQSVAEAGPHLPALELQGPESGRVSSQAEAGRQAQLSRRARTPFLHAVGVVRREERLKTGLGLVPCKDALGLGDVAQAPGVDLHQLRLPEVSRFAV